MKKLFLLALLLAGVLPNRAQGLLREGEVFTFKFELSPEATAHASFGQVGGIAGWYVPFSEVGPGDTARLDMFEDRTLSQLICSKTLTQPIEFLPLECQVPGAWQDFEGAVQLTMVSGSLNNAGWLQVTAILPSEELGFAYHGAVVGVPEPTTIALVCLAGTIGFLSLLRTRTHRPPKRNAAECLL